MFSLKILADNNDDNPSLQSIYVGETVLLCLILDDNDIKADSLIVTLEQFKVTESRRLYSDSTSNIERMRSVDSLLSDNGPLKMKTDNHYQCESWSMKHVDNKYHFSRSFTAQPLSDDAINLNCKFVVSVKQKQLEKTKSDIDPFVKQFLLKEFGPISEGIIEVVDIGSVECPVILCNPIRITKTITPLTSRSCKFGIEIESTEDDILLQDISLSILSAHGPIQTGIQNEAGLTFVLKDARLPLSIGALGETLEFQVSCTTLPVVKEFKSMLRLVVEPEPNRPCLLTFSSRFDISSAFLPPHSDDFTVEFSCDASEVKLGDLVSVQVLIRNGTERNVDLIFHFPLPTNQPTLRLDLADDPRNLSADQLLQSIRSKLMTLPGFICTEAERHVGTVLAGHQYSTRFDFEAVNIGPQWIPPVIMVDRVSGKTVTFEQFLQIKVEIDLY